jgi:cell division protein FtsW
LTGRGIDSGLSVETCARVIAGIAFALTAAGVLMIYSASTYVGVDQFDDPAHFPKRQLLAAAIGAVAFVICTRIRPRFWERSTWWLFGVTAALLVGLFVLGSRFNGATRWYRFLGIGLQPSEVAKLAVIIHAAACLARPGLDIRDFRRGFLPTIGPIVLLAGLVLLEPDFGTALFLGAIGMMVLIVGGLRLSHVLITGAALLPAATVLMITRFEYVRHRLGFFSGEGVGYQVKQGFIALGSGGLFGRGLGAGTGKLFFLPEVAGDFIFPVIGEETGFLGVVLVFALFIAFAWFGLRIARAVAQVDPFAFYLAVGITAWISLQALVNLAVVSGTAPTKGIALPFISYGGTSLVVVLAGTGILLGVAREAVAKRRIDLLGSTS